MTVEEVTKHAQQYSKSFNSKNSVWATDFDAMALKTCLRLLLSKYGVMSVEMQRAYIDDSADTVTLADEKIADDAFDGEVIEAEAAEVTDIPEDAAEPVQQTLA